MGRAAVQRHQPEALRLPVRARARHLGGCRRTAATGPSRPEDLRAPARCRRLAARLSLAAILLVAPSCAIWLDIGEEACDPDAPPELSHVEHGLGGGSAPWVTWQNPQPVEVVFGGQGSPMIVVALGVGVAAGAPDPACVPHSTTLTGPSGEFLASASAPLAFVTSGGGLRITDEILLPMSEVPAPGSTLRLETFAGNRFVTTTLVVEGPE